MISLRRAGERQHDRDDKHQSWFTFYPQGGDPLGDGFLNLRVLNQYDLLPSAAIPALPLQPGEFMTYVREGAVSYQDSSGQSGIIQAGEFRRLTTHRGVRHSETNASRTESASVFQLMIYPSEAEPDAAPEQKRFSSARRRDGLCLVASPDARTGSLRIHQDVSIYSALLGNGLHAIHELAPGRCAWLHLVQGEATIADLVLTTGDGVGITAGPAVSLTARDETEILLIDVRARSSQGRPPDENA